MSAEQRTQGPLDVQNKGTLGTRSARHEIVEGINLDISENMPCVARMPDLSERSYANARHLVACWNCHDDLLAALEDCSASLADFMIHYEGEAVAKKSNTLATARAALAKARKED